MRKLLVLTFAILILVPAAADARSRPRPDLVISDGALKDTGDQLFGSFVVKNKGSRKAASSTAALTTKVGKKTKTLKRFKVKSLKSGKTATMQVAVAIPAGLPVGTLKLKVCADSGDDVREKSESNNCANVGKVKITSTTGNHPPTGGNTPPTGGGTTPVGRGPAIGPASQVPTAPLNFETDTATRLATDSTSYWYNVPDSYDQSNQTPAKLLVWMHGCGGESNGDAYTVSGYPGGDWIVISVDGGRDGGCWDVNNDSTVVLSAIYDVETHFNVDRHHVIIGGYSSGGDLAYRTIFYNANTFAGIIAENTSPFRDTGSSATDSLAAAAWKFNDVHLLHTEDETYPPDGVRAELGQMTDAGFPVTKIEKPGTHSDNHTDSDLQTFLLPHIDDNWTSP